MRIMGLDIGTKRIGVALSDETGVIAQGKGIVRRIDDAQAIEELKAIIGKENVKRIVVGLPLNMDGSKSKSTEGLLEFVGKLKKSLSIPIKLWDERLSTKEADDILIKADVSRLKRKKVVDKLAAQIILQGYLDSLRH